MDACSESPDDVELFRPLLPLQVSKRLCHRLGLPKNAPSNYLGPNCYTAVQLWFNPNQKLEYGNGESFSKFLEGFDQIQFEELRVGDVVVFERVDLMERSKALVQSRGGLPR